MKEILADVQRYTKYHLWVRSFSLSDDLEKPTVIGKAYVGITNFLKDQLKEDKVGYVRAGKTIDQGESAGIINTDHFHKDIIMPISGTIMKANLDFFKSKFWSNSLNSKDWIRVVSMLNPGEISELMLEEKNQEYVNNIILKNNV